MEQLTEIIAHLKMLEDTARPSYEHEELANKILVAVGMQNSNENITALAYFVRYGYVPISDKGSISEAAKNIASAPWVGLDGASLESILQELIEKQLLEFALVDELDNQYVLKIRSSINHHNEIGTLLEELWKKTEQDIKKRKNIVKNV